ncbi:MAG TPA: DUF6798 domain-containing protein [Candidatus Limnocylindrales bacterium]|nr:DUF6798 domain-containing protein [Candidatus Limnocylindrales bacterium]
MNRIVSEPATRMAAGRVRSSQPDWAALSPALVIATALLIHLAVGYRPLPSLDDFAYLPVFRHAADPSLYPRDVLLQQMSLHSLGWYWLFRIADATVGVARGFWAATLLLGVATVAGAWRLSRSLGMSPALFPFLGLLAFASQLNGVGRGAYDGAFGGAMHGQWMALACLLFAYDAFVRRRAVASGIALGLAVLSHVSVAIHGAMVLSIATMLLPGPKIRPLATIALVSALLGAPALAPLAAHLAHSQQAGWTTTQIIDGGYLFRLPHEYTLDIGRTGNLGALLLSLAAIAGALFLRRSPAKRPAARMMALAVGQAALLVLGAVFYTGFPHASLAPYLLAFTRTSPLLVVILWAVALAGLDRFLVERASPVPFHLLAGVALALAVVFELRLFVSWNTASASLLALGAVLCGLRVLELDVRLPRAVLGGLLAALAGIALDASARRDVLETVPSPDAAELYQWSRTSTPADAMFIVPPGFETFRWFARRGAYVDFKLFPPATLESVSTWRERLDDVAEPDRRALALDGWRAAREFDRCYANRNTPQRIAALLARTGADFFVWDSDGLRIPPLVDAAREPSAKLDPVFVNTRFTVYRLRSGLSDG